MPDSTALDNAVIASLTPDEQSVSAIYINDAPYPAGHAVIGGQEMEIDHAYVLAFIDRKPGGNWMHSCRYLAIDPSNQQIVSVESNRPPAFGPLPASWRLIQRSPGVEDWQVLKISSDAQAT
jgi:hypothetical protein